MSNENKFYFQENHGSLGESLILCINGKFHKLELGEWGGYKEHAVLILKETYNIDMKPEDIKLVLDYI